MDIEREISAIQERNRRVEGDKAWEMSWTRRITLFVMTYVIAAAWLWLIRNDRVFLNAFVPAVGFLLSTLSLPVIKRWWLRKRKQAVDS